MKDYEWQNSVTNGDNGPDFNSSPVHRDSLNRLVLDFDRFGSGIYLTPEGGRAGSGETTLENTAAGDNLLADATTGSADSNATQETAALAHRPDTSEMIRHIGKRAHVFFGLGLEKSTPTSQLRFMYDSLRIVPDPDEDTERWIRSFTMHNVVSLGEMALNQRISLPGNNSKPRLIATKQAFKQPGVRKAVIDNMVATGYPAATAIAKLEEWRAAQKRQPLNMVINSAGRTYEQVLFGIHGRSLSALIEEILHKA